MTTQDGNGNAAPIERIDPADYATDGVLDAATLAQEQARLARQVTALVNLSEPPTDAPALTVQAGQMPGRTTGQSTDAVASLVRRRAHRDDHVQPSAVAADPEVYVADGELLVRTGTPAVDVLLADQGFRPAPISEVHGAAGTQDAFDGQVQRFTPGPDAPGVLEAAASAAALGVQAAPNHVTALAMVMKGDGSPENTAVRRHFPTGLARRLSAYAPVTVAVIDTGIVAAQRTDGWLTDVVRSADNEDALDVLPTPNDLLDLGAGHGTFAAGIVQQICPTAQIRVYRAMDTDGLGKEDAAAAAMVQAVLDGAQILNLSLGTQSVADVPPVAFRCALERITRIAPETLIVAAAGNGGNDRPVWPAAFKQVVAVGALTAALQPAEWSSRGVWVDCSTVGEGIVSTYVKGQELAVRGGSVFGDDAWALWSGTSFTAPQIAGAVARLMQGNRPHGWTPRQAFDALVSEGPWLPGYGVALRLLPGTFRSAQEAAAAR